MSFAWNLLLDGIGQGKLGGSLGARVWVVKEDESSKGTRMVPMN